MRRSVSTSRRKPKVRAGAICSTKRLGRHAERRGLVAQQRVVEADRVADAEVVGRARGAPTCRRAPPPPAAGPSGTGAARVSGLQPGLVDQDHEGRRAAVQDRHLGAVHLDAARRRRPGRSSADSRCSTVSTETPSRASVVAWSSRARCSSVAGISTPTSVRRKRMPCSAGAGFRSRRTGLPECRPMPGAADGPLRVFCDRP